MGIIQARMGSTRLPGKVMLSLACTPVIEHVVRRTAAATMIDEVVVATTLHQHDDIVERNAEGAGAATFRGDEEDVLGRIHQAAGHANADIVVRVTGDCPLISPDCADVVVGTLLDTGADYVSNVVDRTFPRGLDVEAFTFESFSEVASLATRSEYREHVTKYYLEHTDVFDVRNVASADVFDAAGLQERTDVRLTLDVAEDYELLRSVFGSLSPSDMISIADVIHHIDEHDLGQLNRHVEQK